MTTASRRPYNRSMSMGRIRIFALLLALLAGAVTFLSACTHDDDDPVVPPVADDVGRVLFIGNSLTQANRLPYMVDTLASASGIRIETTEITVGGWALIDHWNVPATRAAVANGHYDVVVLQQGPSALPESRDSLRAWTKLWDPVIRAAGGRPALYAVWPEKVRFNVFSDVSDSYRLAAEDVDGLFFPVGDTWLETWKIAPNAPLYTTDNFHPSITGTYAAAVVILSVLLNRRPTTLSPDFKMPLVIGAPVDSTVAYAIRQAAEIVIERNRHAGVTARRR